MTNKQTKRHSGFAQRGHVAFLAGLFLAALCAFTSCSETQKGGAEFADWQNKNQTYFRDLYQTAQNNTARYKIMHSWSLEENVATDPEDHIIVESITQGSGTTSPMYSDSVMVHYEGKLLPSPTYAGGFTFDKSWTGAYDLAAMKPRAMAVSGLVDGFATALMHMHPGDRWRVYIPSELGYGATENANAGIPAYSVLVFDVTLVAYYRPGSMPKSVESKPFGGWVTE